MFKDAIIMWINKDNGKMYITANSSDNKTKENWMETIQINFEKSAVKNSPKIVEDFLEDFHNSDFECLTFGFNTRGLGFEYANQLVTQFKTLQYEDSNFTYNKNVKNEWARNDNPSKLYKNFLFCSLPSLFADLNAQIALGVSRPDLAQLIPSLFRKYVHLDNIQFISQDPVSLQNNSYTRDLDKIARKKFKIVKVCASCHMELLHNGICQGSPRCQHYDEIAPFEIKEIKL